MELVRTTLQLPPDDYAVDDRLREIGYGQWEGRHWRRCSLPIPPSLPSARPINGHWPRRAERPNASVQLRMRDWYDQLVTDTVAVAMAVRRGR